MNKARRYIEERDKALYSLNVEEFKAFLRKNGKAVPNYPDWFWRGTMAKMIMNLTNVPEVKRVWARGVLNSLGWSADLEVQNGNQIYSR